MFVEVVENEVDEVVEDALWEGGEMGLGLAVDGLGGYGDDDEWWSR